MSSHGHSHGGGQCNHAHGGSGYPHGFAGIPQGLLPGGHANMGGVGQGIRQPGMGMSGMGPMIPMPLPAAGNMGNNMKISIPAVGNIGQIEIGSMPVSSGMGHVGGMPVRPQQGIQMPFGSPSPLTQGSTSSAGAPVPGALQGHMPPQMELFRQLMAQDNEEADEPIDIFEALDAARSNLDSVAHTCGEPGSVCSVSHGSEEDMKKKMALGQKIMKLLMKNPSVVDQRDKHGNTPLHNAFKNDQVNFATLMIQFGADPNVSNDLDETPVHLACQCGDLKLLHVLRQCGGDINVRDAEMRTCLHHAARRGHVPTMHYLSAYCGLSLRDLNKDQQSVLHICCEREHIDAVKYLLKHDRSDVRQADNEGTTPLHITAQRGNGFLSWLLLQKGGTHQLQCKNREGLTPVALAQRGQTQRHKELAPVLASWAKHKLNMRPSVSWFSYLWNATWPFLTHHAVLLLLSLLPMLSGWAAGLLMLAVTLWIGYRVLRKSSHRLSHISKVPNPLQTATLILGILETLLLFVIVVLPTLWTAGYVVLVVVSVVMVIGLFYLHLKALLADPGYVTESKMKPDGKSCYNLKDLVEGPFPVNAWCHLCELIPSKPTKHCKLCERCCYKMDHHCLFTMNCVGHNNHLLFIRFMVYLGLCNFMFTSETFLYLSIIHPEVNGNWGLITVACYSYPWLFSAIVLNFFLGVWLIYSVVTSIRLVSKGYTYVFRPKNPRHICGLNFSDQMVNTWHFFTGHPEKVVKDPFY